MNDFPKVKLWWGNFHGYVQKNKFIKIITHYSFRGKFNWFIRSLRSSTNNWTFFYPCAMPLPTVITVLNPSASATTSSTTTSIQPTSSGMFLTLGRTRGVDGTLSCFCFFFFIKLGACPFQSCSFTFEILVYCEFDENRLIHIGDIQ